MTLGDMIAPRVATAYSFPAGGGFLARLLFTGPQGGRRRYDKALAAALEKQNARRC